ncbi:MAG TPA: site-2 protease family protein [Candidatus Paceibacterota bacterium]|nr:site-2 protease family protein [Candidatus Paceibacterota bacterium]
MQPELLLSIFSIVILIFSVIIHEVAHGYAANALGDQTAKRAGRLTLNPIPHIDLVGSIIVPATLVLLQAGIMFGWAKPVPYNPYNLKNQRWGEAIVAGAGVATNLLIAVLFAFIARYAFGAGEVALGEIAAIVCLMNLFLGIFNLIPIPPLDGFGVLRGILPFKWGMALRDIEDRVQAGGIISLIAILLIFTQFLAEPFYAFVMRIFMLLLGQ